MPIPAGTPVEAQERLNLMDTGLFAIPFRQLDVNLIIATWNIQNLSEKKSWRALKYMADIIERFDIVAIQEIKSDLRGVSKLLEILPGRYRMLVSDVTGNTERFAFIYDARTVEATGLVSELGFNLDTSTHLGFQLHRMPYMASFKAGRFDFTIVSVHIFDSSSFFKEKEIDALADAIKKLPRRERSKVVDRDIFVLGDFNIKKAGDKFFNALAKYKFVMPSNMDALKTNYLQTGTYDKIAWVKRKDFIYEDRCNIVKYNDVLFQDLPAKDRKKQISDHLPLRAEFKINELTQQLTQIINP